MSRCGRKKLNGLREANGRLCRKANRDPIEAEKLQVLAQKHRRGDADQLRESSLGRFVIHYKLDRALYDAALEYAGMVRCFYAARLPAAALGAIPWLPQDDHVSGGDGVSPEKAIWLGKELRRLETPLRRLSAIGLSAVQALCVFEREIAPQAEPMAARVLCELGSMLRKTGRR